MVVHEGNKAQMDAMLEKYFLDINMFINKVLKLHVTSCCHNL